MLLLLAAMQRLCASKTGQQTWQQRPSQVLMAGLVQLRKQCLQQRGLNLLWQQKSWNLMLTQLTQYQQQLQLGQEVHVAQQVLTLRQTLK
jgi:hypothetical protein